MLLNIGKGLQFDIPEDAWKRMLSHDAVKDHCIYIGAKNILTDCHASVVRTDFESDKDWQDAKLALVNKKWAAMLEGDIRANSGTVRQSSLSPIDAECRRLARIAVLSVAKAKGITDKEKIAAAIAKYAAKPETIATATANVEAAKALQSDDIDL